jgi:hypothetical protein
MSQGLQSGGLQAWATNLGSGSALIALGPTVWGPTSWGATDLGSGSALIELGPSVWGLQAGVYRLGQPI